MSLATFSYMIGALELLVGIPLIVAPKKTVAWMRKFMDHEVLMRTVSAFLVVLSFLVLRHDWSIGSDTAGLMRLVAWIVGIKHILACWWPDRMKKMADSWLSNSSMYIIWGLIAVVLGVLFIMAGDTLS